MKHKGLADYCEVFVPLARRSKAGLDKTIRKERRKEGF